MTDANVDPYNNGCLTIAPENLRVIPMLSSLAETQALPIANSCQPEHFTLGETPIVSGHDRSIVRTIAPDNRRDWTRMHPQRRSPAIVNLFEAIFSIDSGRWRSNSYAGRSGGKYRRVDGSRLV